MGNKIQLLQQLVYGYQQIHLVWLMLPMELPNALQKNLWKTSCIHSKCDWRSWTNIRATMENKQFFLRKNANIKQTTRGENAQWAGTTLFRKPLIKIIHEERHVVFESASVVIDQLSTTICLLCFSKYSLITCQWSLISLIWCQWMRMMFCH